MHGHAQSGSRKLNRHWQSGKMKGTGLDENLVFFEREIDVTEWKVSDSPYWIYTSTMGVEYLESHEPFSKRSPIRNKHGIKPFVILQPGDYKVNWRLSTHRISSFRKDGTQYEKIVEGDRNNNFGMFGINMYGMGQFISIATQRPDYMIENGDTKYYVGHAENYISNNDTSTLNDSPFFTNSDIVQRVYPARSSTKSLLGGSSTFNMVSGQEQSDVILHIGGSAPFPQYQYSTNSSRKEAFFRKYFSSFSPAIWFLFTENISSLGTIAWAVTGKIWLERVGDYTETDEGWKAEILNVPEGYTILGDKGIIE